jgi:hypothetical protein
MSRLNGSSSGRPRRLSVRLSACVAAATALTLACAAAPAGAVDPVVAQAAGDASPPPVAWFGLREGKAEARHRDRPLLVFFTASWSTTGARLDRQVWTDRRLRRYVAEHLVAARVEFQESPGVARHFGIAEPPALLVISPQGEPLIILRGEHGVDSYLRVATFAGSRAWEYTDYATWLTRRGNR